MVLIKKLIIFLVLVLASSFLVFGLASSLVIAEEECTTEQDCINSGKCNAGMECSCSKNKCYTGLVEDEDEKLERMLKAFDKLNYQKGVIIVAFTQNTTKEVAINILNKYNLSLTQTEVCMSVTNTSSIGATNNPSTGGPGTGGDDPSTGGPGTGGETCWTEDGWDDFMKWAKVIVPEGEEKEYAEMLIKEEKIIWVSPSPIITTSRASNINELKEIIKERREELKEEIKNLKENQKKIYGNQNEVRAAVHALLAMKDLIGGIGPNVSAIATEFNNSIRSTINAEERLQNRSNFKKFWVGSDKQAIKDLDEKINRSDELIAQLEEFKAECNCSDDVKATLQEQIDLLKQEQDRLKLLIQVEKKKKGLFGWLKK